MDMHCSSKLDLVPFHTEREKQLYHRLLVMAHGDRALVDRLVRYEANQAPTASRSDLIDAAIQRWISDLNRWR